MFFRTTAICYRRCKRRGVKRLPSRPYGEITAQSVPQPASPFASFLVRQATARNQAKTAEQTEAKSGFGLCPHRPEQRHYIIAALEKKGHCLPYSLHGTAFCLGRKQAIQGSYRHTSPDVRCSSKCRVTVTILAASVSKRGV